MIETTHSKEPIPDFRGNHQAGKVAIRPDPHVQAVVEQSREAEMLRAKAMDEAMGAVRHSDDAAGTS